MEKFCNEAYFMFFSTLADKINLAIIDALMDVPKSSSEIAASLGLEAQVVSSNLDQLMHCALVRAEPPSDGSKYSLNLEIVVPLSELVAFHIAKHCPGMRECITADKLRDHLKKEAAKETYIEH